VAQLAEVQAKLANAERKAQNANASVAQLAEVQAKLANAERKAQNANASVAQLTALQEQLLEKNASITDLTKRLEIESQNANVVSSLQQKLEVAEQKARNADVVMQEYEEAKVEIQKISQSLDELEKLKTTLQARLQELNNARKSLDDCTREKEVLRSQLQVASQEIATHKAALLTKAQDLKTAAEAEAQKILVTAEAKALNLTNASNSTTARMRASNILQKANVAAQNVMSNSASCLRDIFTSQVNNIDKCLQNASFLPTYIGSIRVPSVSEPIESINDINKVSNVLVLDPNRTSKSGNLAQVIHKVHELRELAGMPNKQNIEDVNGALLYYVELIRYLISTPTMYRLGALTINDMETLRKNTAIQIHHIDGPNIDKELAFSTLYKFMYIDITPVLLLRNHEQFSSFYATHIKDYLDLILRDTRNADLVLGQPREPIVTMYMLVQRLADIMYELAQVNKANIIIVKEQLLDYILDTASILQVFITELHKHIESEKNTPFQYDIDKLLYRKVKSNVLTFVKIRNDDDAMNVYNNRFQVQLSTNPDELFNKNTLLVKYNGHNLPYYQKEDDYWSSSVRLETDFNALYPNKVFSDYFRVQRGELDVRKYDEEYLLGPFTRVFPSDQTNPEIAQQLDEVTSVLLANEPKPVFLIGYGASGAGKTSTLIYFNKGQTSETRNGILMHLCSILGPKYQKIRVKSFEFLVRKNEEGVTVRRSPESHIPGIDFEYTSSTFVSVGDYTHVNAFSERNSSNATKVFPKGSELGHIVEHLIDIDRFVKATTNNPNSSRSHTLVFINFSADGTFTEKDRTLIIGDFAGVENLFDCEDKQVIKKFLNIKKDNSQLPFYSEPNSTVMTVGGGKRLKRMRGGDKDDMKQCLPFITSSDDLFVAGVSGRPQSFMSSPDSPPLMKVLFKDNKTYHTALGAVAFNAIRSKSVSEDQPLTYLHKLDISEAIELFSEYPPSKLTDNNLTHRVALFLQKLLTNTTNTRNLASKSDITFAFELFNMLLECNELDTTWEHINRGIHLPKLEVKNGQSKKGEGRYQSTFDSSTVYGLSKINNTKLAPGTITEGKQHPLTKQPLQSGAQTNYIEHYFFNGTTNKFTNERVKDNLMLQVIKQEFDNKYAPIQKVLSSNALSLSELKRNITTGRQFIKKDMLALTLKTIEEMSQSNSGNSRNSANEIEKLAHVNVLSSEEVYNKFTDILSHPLVQILGFGLPARSLNLSTIAGSLLKFLQVENNRLFVENMIKDEKTVEQVTLKLYDETRTLLLQSLCREAYGQKVCTVRRKEGEFINGSLSDIRDVIKEIMYEKNKDSINITPFFLQPCLPSYCVNGQCFKLKKPAKPNTSVIFDIIRSELGRPSYAALKDLVVGVFCVLNLSRKANNPPPVPYINTNDIYYHMNKSNIITQGMIDALGALIESLNVYRKDFSPVKVVLPKRIEDFVMNVYDNLPKSIGRPLDLNSENNLRAYLTLLDNISAASAIGTLQFVDSMSKYNATHVLCAHHSIKEHPQYNTIIQKLNFIDIQKK
jgi:hypothetical protein